MVLHLTEIMGGIISLPALAALPGTFWKALMAAQPGELLAYNQLHSKRNLKTPAKSTNQPLGTRCRISQQR